MKKVIVRTREDELTVVMARFGNNCAMTFIKDLDKNRKQISDDWDSCAYSNDYMSCWVKISKSGTVSACVFNK